MSVKLQARAKRHVAIGIAIALVIQLMAPFQEASAQQAAPAPCVPAPTVSGQEPGCPGAPALGPGQSSPGTQAPGAPSTLMPVAPPVAGTAGQPLPPSVVPGQPTPGPGQVPAGRPSAVQSPAQAPGQAPTTAPGAQQAPGAPAQEAAPTFIEKAFSELQAPLSVDRRLRQFGYNLFEAPSSTFAPVQDVPVGPEYVIGPGDTLVINMWGLAEGNFPVVVSRNGEIFLPKTGPIRVAGLKFAEMETLVKDQLTQYYTRVNISVTMGPLRTLKVFILGEVVKPGAYTVSSLSTITNALFAAGGPSTQGSLRDIRLIRSNQIIGRLDLYKFLLEGKRAGDERLLADDTIFVPPIGPVVALAGYVKRPAIYELKEERTLDQLLEMGGGLTILSYVRRVQVERVVERQRKMVLDRDFADLKDFEAQAASFMLQEGDFVSVFPIERKLYSFVSLEGNVKRPGTYALKPGLAVKDLIEQGEGLLPGTYMERADLARFRDAQQYETVPVDLTAVMAGEASQNLLLNQFDRVIVYHRFEIQPKAQVQITGAVYRAGVFELTPNMRVSDLVFKGSPTRQASLGNAEMYRADPGSRVTVIRLDLEAIVASPRGEKDLLLTDRDHIFIRQLSEGVEKRTVSISGRVRYPGEYAIIGEERLSSLLERAGGFLQGAFPRGAVFTRESVRRVEQEQLDRFLRGQEQALLAESAGVTAGLTELSNSEKTDVATAQAAVTAQRRELIRSLAASITLGRVAIQIESVQKLKGSPDDVTLENGDSLFIPQQPTSVAIVGAVRSSTAVLYKEKENIDYYINRAGGPTREADVDQIYLVKPDGSALASFVPIRTVEAGDAIIVPISTEPKIRAVALWKDLATIVAGFSLPVATIWALVK